MFSKVRLRDVRRSRTPQVYAYDAGVDLPTSAKEPAKAGPKPRVQKAIQKGAPKAKPAKAKPAKAKPAKKKAVKKAKTAKVGKKPKKAAKKQK